MSLKNNWKPKTDDDYVEAEDINAVADAVIELEEKILSGGVTPDGTTIIIDDEMSPTSENPVQNKVVKAYIDEQNTSTRAMASGAGQMAQQANQKAQETSETLIEHTTSEEAHNDIRLLIQTLTNRLNAIADSEDIELDQLSEIVAYIKSNKSLIDSITTSKVNVADIIDNLTTNVSDRPLSASQGVYLYNLINQVGGTAAGAGSTASYAKTTAEEAKQKAEEALQKIPDTADIVNAVIAELPIYNGEAVTV